MRAASPVETGYLIGLVGLSIEFWIVLAGTLAERL